MALKIDKIWNDFHNSLLYYIRGRIKTKEDAEDILQNVFIKISQNIDKLDDTDKITSWIYKITQNSIIDFYRSAEHKRSLLSDSFVNEPEAEEFNGDDIPSNIKNCLHSMIDKLPDKYSSVLKLYEAEKLSHKEIAAKLGISLSGSKTRVQRSREKLKELLVNKCRFETDVYGNVVHIKNDNSECNICSPK